jgi:hypothetical protein
VTDAELRGLLIDCLTLWQLDGRVAACDAGVEVTTIDGAFVVQRADPDLHPIRWMLHTPSRRAANRPPRVASSIGALLSALRNALGGERGVSLRISAGGLVP